MHLCVCPNQVRELKFLRKLKHPNIITLLDDFEDDDGLYFVFEVTFKSPFKHL